MGVGGDARSASSECRGSEGTEPVASPRAENQNVLHVDQESGGWNEGQSTIEYLMVMLGIIAVVAGLSALSGLGEGTLARLASDAASHSTRATGTGGGLADVLMY